MFIGVQKGWGGGIGRWLLASAGSLCCGHGIETFVLKYIYGWWCAGGGWRGHLVKFIGVHPRHPFISERHSSWTSHRLFGLIYLKFSPNKSDIDFLFLLQLFFLTNLTECTYCIHASSSYPNANLTWPDDGSANSLIPCSRVLGNILLYVTQAWNVPARAAITSASFVASIYKISCTLALGCFIYQRLV